MQLYDCESGVFNAPFLVAASSLGGEVQKKVCNFRKGRGDDEWMQSLFTPFTLELSRKLLNFYGVVIEDRRISDAVVEGKKISHEEVGDKSPYYNITPRVTRSKSKIVKPSAESADVTVEQGKEEKAAGEAAMASGSGLVDSSIATQINKVLSQQMLL